LSERNGEGGRLGGRRRRQHHVGGSRLTRSELTSHINSRTMQKERERSRKTEGARGTTAGHDSGN